MAVSRGRIFHYDFTFAGQRFSGSTKSTSSTVAQRAEDQRRREVEAGHNNITEVRRNRIRDDDTNREQYEFPEVEKALPECIQKTLASDDHRAFMLRARRLLRKHRSGRYQSWIERLHAIERLSRVRLPTDVYFREDGGYDTIPLPSLLVAFKENDAIVACFDEEGQYMLEGSAEPTVGVVFSPHKPEEVRRAGCVVGRFVALNYEVFQLVEALAEWETIRHAGTHLDRGEPSLRAA